MRDAVARLAGALRGLGLSKGDRVLIYMPMVPEAVMAMLACARIGAIHSVVFGGFAAPELASRIDDCTPKLVVSASCGIEPQRVVAYKPQLDQAIDLAAATAAGLPHPAAARLTAADLVAGRDHDWHRLVATATPAACVPVAATDPLYILYTSGTTGIPKGIVRHNGGHAVALCWSMKHIYGLEPGEVMFTASDVGWVVGHSYIVYAPLIYGCTSVLFEGKPIGTPDAGVFWRVISEHKVAVMFTSPTAFRAIKREDPDGTFIAKYDLGKFRALFLAGERADPATVDWAEQKLGVPVVDHWWPTETGWPITANCLGIEKMRVKHGSSTKPVPGWDLRVLDAAGAEVAPGTIGALCLKLPLPPCALPTLWNADERFVDAYLARLSRLLPHGRCRLRRCGRLCLRHDAHRRHHQYRRPSPVDRRHRGGAGGTSRGRGMRGDRRVRCDQGPGAARPAGAEERRRDAAGRGRRAGRSIWCATASGRWPPSRPRSWWRACPRRGQGRSCGGPCAASPTACPTACRRRSTTRRY